jgi:two-component system sensor histidine kinase UhpB
MSLRLRIVAAIVLVLALGSDLGLALAGWHARAWLREELQSAQTSGRLAILRDLADLAPAGPSERQLKDLVATLDGNRHVMAQLLGPGGRIIAVSRPEPAKPPPPWFSFLLAEKIAPETLAVPGAGRMIELRPVFANDMAVVWAEFTDLVLVLALASASGAVVVFIVVGQALRPLRAVGAALPRIGAGDYRARAPERGPPELAALGRGVNEMTRRLAEMRERNRALEEQILTLQDEERADIARDLHDEFGPQLFAANVDAAMAASLIASGRPDEALAQVRSIAGAIAHMQRLVRDILGRLRPPRLAELGLAKAVLDLTAFWRARRPEIAFETELERAEDLPEAAQEALYRIVQESLSNAVRHGEPTRIGIRLDCAQGVARIEISNDGAPEKPALPGYGLTGMTERVAALGGRISAGPRVGGVWRVEAELPIVPEAAAA